MNILLVCSAGMSTSLLVTKMEKAAEAKGIEAKIWAVSADQAGENIDNADVLLLGPQVRYLLNDVKKMAESKPVVVDVINQVHYGLMNGEAVLETALGLVNNQ
ncbi:Lichenan-specific phosphotransferase enzyme IIB component [Peribacillus sp. Bi96]|uniref:PTS sugar transporter subunit IIB n=1 Tax=unclassified Peribacillus TaxID=2675266 RepID=UPI001D89F16E|nr:PTS sugar transporter subunit IIB [Peribacillus sp. Bi96]CAH0308046.1 Lichenan-specific phosphotransferase enzyme IIB component [Peribacillus sp. Bi96]